MILTLITTDGRRECIERTVASMLEQVAPLDGPRVIVDDSGDSAYREWLREAFNPLGFQVLGKPIRSGQDRMLDMAWRELARPRYRGHPWVFHCEDDFLFHRPVDLRVLTSILEADPHLAQIALLRQPWFPGEVSAGGIVERDPDQYQRRRDGHGNEWLEHRLWFTLNPCIYRRALCERGWPQGRRHEWRFSRSLCEDERIRFALWGDGTPWVEHIGHERVGTGY